MKTYSNVTFAVRAKFTTYMLLHPHPQNLRFYRYAPLASTESTVAHVPSYIHLNIPPYRLFVADSRSPRDGKHLECVGHYDPTPCTCDEGVDVQQLHCAAAAACIVVEISPDRGPLWVAHAMHISSNRCIPPSQAMTATSTLHSTFHA